MRAAEANPDWAVGFCDECWWSRLALPTLSSWSEAGEPLRLIQHSVAKEDPEPKAVSCYGLYVPELDDTWLRFVDGRPVSSITTRFLSWCCENLEAAGKKVLVLIWDNASWHISRQVRRWLGKHNREVKKSGRGVRIASCLLPKQSPWLNAIEPKNGYTPSARWSSPIGCWALMNSPTESVGSSVVRITSIFPFHRRSPDHALEALGGVVLGLLLVLSLGGRSMMCGMLGVGDGVLGQMFALVGWALLIALIVTLVSWIVNQVLAR